MAGEERDARLILRAEDRASRTFDQVGASVKRVRKEIVDQGDAARAGAADVEAMKRQLEELKQAGDDLVRGQSLIRQFETLTDKVGNAEERLKKARDALAAYQEKAGANPTDNQSTQIEKRMAAVERAQRTLDNWNAKLDETTAKMGRMGLSTTDTTADYNRLAATAQQTAQAIAQVKNQIEETPAAAKRAAAALEEMNAANALAGRVDNLKPADFDFIQSLDSAKAKLEAITAIEQREAAASRQYVTDMSARWQLALRSLRDQEKGERDLAAAAQRNANDEAKRLADLNAFRQLGTDAAEAAVKTERYAASVQNLGNDFQSFSQSVRTALGGTQSALQDIGQALAQIDASAETLEKPKTKINELQESSGKLAIAIATLDRTARNIDGFRLQEQAVARTEAAFNEAQAEVLRLAAAIEAADAPSEALASDMAQAERALERAGQAMQKARNDAVQMGEALRRAGVDTDNLEAEMVRFQAAAQRAGGAAQGFAGKLRGKDGFLGLNAFEMQNLGYQVNDIFTQLGSGTGIMQILAQQGPQIVQIFGGLGGTLLSLAPAIAAVTLLLSPFIGALIQAKREADALRQAQVLLAGTGEMNPNAVQQYTEAGVQLRNLGVSAKDTQAALEAFHSAGLNPEGLEAYSQALADATKGGADMGESSKLLAEALSGNIEQVEALNDKFNILTPTEEAQIAAMIESGNTSEARRIIFEKFEDTAARMADKANGPWSKAWDNLGTAFNNFTRYLSNTAPIKAMGAALDWLRDKVTGAIDDLAYFFNYASKRGFIGTLNDAGFFGGGPAARGGKASQDAADYANRRGRRADTPFPAQAQNDTLEGGRAVRKLREELDDARDSTRKLSREETLAAARRKALAGAVGSPAQRQQQADLAAQKAGVEFDAKAAKAAEKSAKKDKSARDKAARAAEALANQRRAIEEQLATQLDAIDKKVADGQLASIEQRREGVLEAYTGLFQKLDEARRKGVTKVDGMSLTEYEAQVRSQIAILQNQAEMKAREEQINATIKERTDDLKTIEDQLGRDDITPQAAMQAYEETISRFAPKVTQMTADALAFARSLRGATPDPKLESMIAKLERIQQQNSGGQDASLLKTLRLDVVEDEGKNLNQVLAERDELVRAQNALVKLGVQTQSQAQQNIEDAYARTNPKIQEQIDKMRELLAIFANDPSMQTFYDTWMAKLSGVEAQSQYVSAEFTQLKSGIDSLITQNAVNAIDSIAQAFSRLALGQQSAVDTLMQIGAAFAQFIAQTIIGIAKLILQVMILKAVETFTGIPIGAMLKFMGGAGSAFHNGGVVGPGGQGRSFARDVPMIAFANAPRYHGGGIAGFAPDEVPAILKRNEEVLTEQDPRHRNNLTGSETTDAGAPAGGLRQVLVLDPGEMANALAGPAGEKVVVTHIRKNKATIKQLLGD